MQWLHSDIRPCCCRSLHTFTFRHDFTLLSHTVFTPKVVLHETSSLFVKLTMTATSNKLIRVAARSQGSTQHTIVELFTLTIAICIIKTGP